MLLDGFGSVNYDPSGRLYQIDTGTTSSRTRFVYAGDSLIAEYNNSGNLIRRYVHGPGIDEPVVMYNGTSTAASNRRYYHQDHQGSIMGASTSAGASSFINRYDAWGIPAEGNQGRFSYTGQIFLPELDLYYYRARMYSPYLGRFLQTDPIGYEDQMNLYAYVHNDPVNFRDPTGMIGIGFGNCETYGTNATKCRPGSPFRNAEQRQNESYLSARVGAPQTEINSISGLSDREFYEEFTSLYGMSVSRNDVISIRSNQAAVLSTLQVICVRC